MEITFKTPVDGVAEFPAVFSIPDADLDIELIVTCDFIYEPGEAASAISPGSDEAVSVSSISIAHVTGDVCGGVLPMLQFSANAFEESILQRIREEREELVIESKAEEAYHASL